MTVLAVLCVHLRIRNVYCKLYATAKKDGISSLKTGDALEKISKMSDKFVFLSKFLVCGNIKHVFQDLSLVKEASFYLTD